MVSQSPLTNDVSLTNTLSDAELTSLALRSDPNVPLELDAVPWIWNASDSPNGLPEWYMPRASAVGRGRGTKLIVVAIVVGLLVIDAFGLCITSGFLSLA